MEVVERDMKLMFDTGINGVVVRLAESTKRARKWLLGACRNWLVARSLRVYREHIEGASRGISSGH